MYNSDPKAFFPGTILKQSEASLKINLHNLQLFSNNLATEGAVRDIARLASLSIKDSHAGNWLTANPSPSLGLLLKPPEFVAAVRYRLGNPIFSANGPSDRFGDHAMNCAGQGERIARHNYTVDFHSAITWPGRDSAKWKSTV